MKQERFKIRAYGKSELALLYFPDSSKESAMRSLRRWLAINNRLRGIIGKKKRHFTPKEVRIIVEELGEPFDTE